MATSRIRDEQLRADRIRVDGVNAGWSFARIAEEIYLCCHESYGTTMLRAHRLARGWAPDTVLSEIMWRYRAERNAEAKLDRSLLSNWESGRLTVGPTYLPHLLDLYGVTSFAPGRHLEDETTPRMGEGRDLKEICLTLLDAVRANNGEMLSQGAMLSRRRQAIYGLASRDGAGLTASSRSLMDEGRDAMEQTFSSETVSPGRLDALHQTVLQRRIDHRYSSPIPMLAQLLLDWFEVQGLLIQRQPVKIQRALYSIAAPIGLLIADTLMKLGEIDQSRRYYDLAARAARETGSRTLSALVPAQQAMLPYYYGVPTEALSLAEEAQRLAGGHACVGSALGAAMEARVRARLAAAHPGNTQLLRDAQLAWGHANDSYERLDGHQRADMALSFPVRRHFFYSGATAGYLGQHERLDEARRQAEQYYPPGSLDLTLMDLDVAVCLIRSDPTEACVLTINRVGDLAPEHRTAVVMSRIREVAALIPQHGCKSTAARRLRELNAAGHMARLLPPP